MSTYNIQLKNNTSFEKYQMAVRVLEAIGIEIVEKNGSAAQSMILK